MKKIGLLTIHSANSYGGILQAYASQQVLSRYGHVEVLDYKTRHIHNTMKLIRWIDGPRSLLRAGKDLFRVVPRARLLRKFRMFVDNHLRLSTRMRSIRELADHSSSLDIVICGSDQIWNPKVIGSLDPAFFLGFETEAKKISLSSSMGSYRYNDVDRHKISEWLQPFAALSVRESDTAEYLENVLGRGVCTTIDPTLMLPPEHWRDLEGLSARRYAGKYIFVYALRNSVTLSKCIEIAKSMTGLKIIAIDQNPFKTYFADEHIQDAGPLEFLGAIINAQFVITNSFHGAAFCANLGKRFAVLEPETGRNRIHFLLNTLDMPERMINSPREIEHLIETDLSPSVQTRLNEQRQAVDNYLSHAIGGV